MNRIVIVKPNGSCGYDKAINEFKACEPPIWHLLLADYYKTNLIIDAEVDNLNHYDIGKRALVDMKADKVVILATGSHPSGFIQQREEMTKLYDEFSRFVDTESYSSLTINPLKYKVDWDLVDLEKYKCHNWHSFTNNLNASPYGVVYTSISCPFKCSFCCIHQFYGSTYRERPIVDVIKDFDDLAKREVVNIKIMDELFIAKPERVHRICDDIIGKGYKFNIWAYARIDIMNDRLLKKMKKAGINWLAYGIESGNDTIRQEALKGKFTKDKIKEVIKMTHDNGIEVIGNYMFGFWEDNKETMQETLDLSMELNTSYVNFYCLTAFPDTKFYNDLVAQGVEMPRNWSEYAQMSKEFKPMQTKYLKGEEVLTFRDSAFQQYFRNHDYLTMIEKKFGEETLVHLDKMIHKKIGRLHC